MAFDIKEKLDEIVDRIKGDDSLAEKFKSDPVAAIESIIGIDLPDDKADDIVEAVKAKLNLDAIGDKLGGLFGR